MKRRLGIVLTIALPLVAFGAPPVSGPYAKKLSKIDIEQVQTAIAKEQGIPRNVRRIEAIRPDKVAVQTGGKRGLNMEIYYDFTVSKRAGKWAVDANSVQITDEPMNNHRLDSDATGR